MKKTNVTRGNKRCVVMEKNNDTIVTAQLKYIDEWIIMDQLVIPNSIKTYASVLSDIVEAMDKLD